MALTKSIPSFTNTSVPSGRYIGPFCAYGRCDQTNSLNSYYKGWAVYFLGLPRVITTAKFEVVSAMTSTGSPLIQLAAYYPTNVSGEVRVGKQIPNSLATGIDPTTTGVKTVTFTTPWQAPSGLFFILIKAVASVGNSTGTIRSFNQNSGQTDYIWAQFMGGFNASNPTNLYATPAFPEPDSFGNSQELLADYTNTAVYYDSRNWIPSSQPSSASAIMLG
jgi:hypothetical protein